MLREAMEAFTAKLQKPNGERLVLDAYVPKNGTYRLIELGKDSFRVSKTLDIAVDKKNDTIIGSTDEDYPLIRSLDYYSKLIEMNKPVDSSKTIHTNNYMSLAVKKESILNGKYTAEVLGSYYETLADPLLKYGKKAKTKELYQQVESEIGPPDRELIQRIHQIAASGAIWDGMDLNGKGYVKIFFVFENREKTLEVYKQEYKRYMIPNIYNNNEFNVRDESGISGLPGNNMGMNSKKPYLENKSRKVKVPYLLNQEDAMLQSQLFDYFMGQVSKGRYHIYIENDEDDPRIISCSNKETPDDFSEGYYLRLRMDKNEAAIVDADVISDYNPNLFPPFMVKDHIGVSDRIPEKYSLNYNQYCNQVWEIKALIDQIFLENSFSKNLDTEAKDISIQGDSGGRIKRCLLKCRSSLIDWFYKGEQRKAVQVLEDVTLELIRNSLRRGDTLKAMSQFNLRWSLLDYFDENRRMGERMENVRMKLREHINLPGDAEWQFESDEEFGVAVGQAVSYFVSLSKAYDRTEALINPFLNAKDVKMIKNRLLQMYKKYNYRISHNGVGRVQKLMSHIMEYEPEKICREEIMVGFTAANMIYEKKNESEESEHE